MIFNFEDYLSPFTWRYGSKEMRYIFSEKHKYELWRKIWVSLAESQYETGIISKKEFDDIKKNQNNIDINKILQIEKETKHDVVAAIKEFASKTKIGGGKIHLGATSMDIVDNADSLKIKEALSLICKKLIALIEIFEEKIKKYSSLPCIGYTHLQPAEPTTVGYRLAFYAQDLLTCLDFLKYVKKIVRAKGIRGAVGTSASFQKILQGKNAGEIEEKIMSKLGLSAGIISSQVYPRLYDYFVLNLLSSIAGSVSKFAADLRILQSAQFGEWSEPFGEKQVGSSAMPFKKNPVSSENICSLARYVMGLPKFAIENASLSYLERTLDDSANKRIIMAESFLAVDQILDTAKKIVAGLIINEKRIKKNLDKFAAFSATESIIIAAVENGANRQRIHEVLRNISMEAWTKLEDKPEIMKKLLLENKTSGNYLSKKGVEKLLDVRSHTGNAVKQCNKLLKLIRRSII